MEAIGRSSRGSVDWNFLFFCHQFKFTRRSSRGSVDWNIYGWSADNIPPLSRSSRGSVDWNLYIIHLIHLFSVAPLVGAWIEIIFITLTYVWVSVAPLVGAWIEMLNLSASLSLMIVAPLVGAWIEIRKSAWRKGEVLSLLSWERGLKSDGSFGKHVRFASLLSWERGLKLTGLEDSENERPSLLSWERGLKCSIKPTAAGNDPGRSSRGSVDWNIKWKDILQGKLSRSSRGSVDWN